MKKILYIGGVGSDSYLVGTVVRSLSTMFTTNVIGLSFSAAYNDQAKIARLAPDCLIIAHAGALVLLKNTAPKELVAIAPPMPTVPSLLFLRGFGRTSSLLLSGGESHGRPQKLLNYHLHSLKEHIARPYQNNMLLSEISLFNAAQIAVEMVRCGSKVTLGFMENDHLFPDASQHPHIELARSQGVTVYDTVIGHHDEFALYPVEVMAQLGYRVN